MPTLRRQLDHAEEMTNPTVLLGSGLSVRSGNSFRRQLTLLAGAFARLGVHALVVGTSPQHPSFPELDPAARTHFPKVFDVPSFTATTARSLVERFGASALILLGYPDQFPFLRTTPDTAFPPVFLWAQLSRPTDLSQFRFPFRIMPLTETTAVHLPGVCRDRVGATIPHGVDTAVFSPAVAGGRSKGSKAFTVGTVGANTTRKRFDLLLEGFRVAVASGTPAKLVIKTDRAASPGGFDLPGTVARIGLTESVRIVHEDLSDRELADLYRSLDLYVHTAEWEGFGIPVVEAMACGIPVAVAPTQGPLEIVPYMELTMWDSPVIRDGDTVLRHTKPSEVARVIRTVARHRDMPAHLSATGRRHACRRHDIAVVAQRWLTAIKSMTR